MFHLQISVHNGAATLPYTFKTPTQCLRIEGFSNRGDEAQRTQIVKMSPLVAKTLQRSDSSRGPVEPSENCRNQKDVQILSEDSGTYV